MNEKAGRYRTGADGFTLIEIMVALTVVAIAFISFYRLFSQSIGADSVARFYTVAPLLAQEKLAEMNAGIISINYEDSGTFEDYPGFSWQARILDVTSEALKKAVSDMKQVDITISGQDDNRQFSLRAYVFLRN